MRYGIALACVLFLTLVFVFAQMNQRELAPEELARRCAASHPAWNGYQEDIKEIGAGPVAQWHGAPIQVSMAGGIARLGLALQTPWSEWDAALPLLVKTPEGLVFRNTSVERDGTVCTYVFVLSDDPASPLPPWLELQYPSRIQPCWIPMAPGRPLTMTRPDKPECALNANPVSIRA